ncbi:GNAT family N-acetyltransferase [Deinococcus sp. Arct2-2]|uniref:GNAT family N-acetyltransferase n=1 Tax=Deinococcus sp. Arct2-2 TaxID=2568653 RepID=UPI0010A4C109|nr:GNAT family protein [Deinococcus sp. Arct2-2]THF69645.1 GNAT family N-acetyltransferase [Deinococcus sp. Arct2-2]
MAVTLRPLRAGDEQAAVRWAADSEFCLAAGWTPHLAPRVVQTHWKRLIAGAGPDFLRLGIEENAELVGYVDLANKQAHTAELGVAIGERAQWGRGLAHQACRLVLAHAFGPLGLQTVTAQVHAPNLRSHRLMLGLGFTASGRAEPELYRGEWVEVVCYLLGRESFLGCG